MSPIPLHLPPGVHAPALPRRGTHERLSAELVGARPANNAAGLSFATLSDDPRLIDVIQSVRSFALTIGVQLDWLAIPAELARRGTVGRIGLPQAAIGSMLQQKVLIGSGCGDPLAPVSRLWRGLQRRSDVLVDIRKCRTLPGSDADRAGMDRDVVLFSQRVVERGGARRFVAPDSDSADQWARARHAAEIAYRMAATDNRKLLLVLPVGRGTASQRLFTEALERHARVQRLPAPRVVKAGLLSALLTGETGRERLLVASVMSIDELSATATEAIGETGPWPVVSLGRHASFYDMPRGDFGAVDPMPLLLVLEHMLQYSGRTDIARSLLQSSVLTSAALTRMRDEMGAPIDPAADDFLRGVMANWGRAPISGAGRERSAAAQTVPTVAGLRLRVETPLAAAAMRDVVSAALMPAGLEVASVRGVDTGSARANATFEVRVRSRLGEPSLSDDAAQALVGVLGPTLRCIAVEPWIPAAAADRVRSRTAALA